jgi:polysaccharide pyruvyl transferase WcaK-like protein
MKLGLLTTTNTNIGDDFIREGLVHCVHNILPETKLEVVLLNKHEPETIYPRWHPIRLFDKKKIKPRFLTKPIRVLTERFLPPLGGTRFDDCDVLIQCGTPILWQGCRQSEWARMIWQEVLARLARTGTPLLNLGGGSCYPWEQLPETLAGNPDEKFVRLMLDAADLTTVRDRLARKLFASLGYDARELCCPALLAAQAHVRPTEPTRKVLINYMAGGGHYAWNQAIDAKLWEQTMRTIVAHLAQTGWQPVFLAHDPKELNLAAALWPDFPRVCPESVRAYFEFVRDAAFGVVNRMHASVALAGLGIPSVAVGTDSRNLMVEQLGLPVFYVKDATPERLRATIDFLQRNQAAECQRLLALRETSLKEYTDCMRPFFSKD